MNGYEKTYELGRPLLKDADLSGAARRLGFTPLGPDRLGIEFLGRPYEITREGVFPVDGKPANVNALSILVYYAASQGGAEAESAELRSASIKLCGESAALQRSYASQEFALLNYFTGSLFSGSSTGTGLMTKPLVEAYGKEYGKFAIAAKQFGMKYEGSPHNGEHSWQYRVLPRLPVRLVYYEADEEFPCEVKIYYEKSVKNFLEFEPMAVLTGCLVHALAKSGL
jgi:hypothetical protein